MYSNVLIAFALIYGASARIANKHVGDFRLFAKPGCFDGNLGVWTVIDDDVVGGRCQSLNEHTVQSIFATSVEKNCTLSFYKDRTCQVGRTDAAQGNCYSARGKGFKSWTMTC